MKINVKLFGLFQAGLFNQKELLYPTGTKVQDVIDDLHLPQRHLGIVLINGVHADSATILTEGDHLVLLPLLGGG